MIDSAAKNPPDPAGHPVSSPQSRALLSHLRSFNETVSNLGELSRIWKAMNGGDDCSGWQRRWRAAQASLGTLQELSVPSPSLAVSG